ncbi:calponin homology domain-containing protein DDB_G0272472-like isoform X2 [Tribolium madens]|uniref:calponin homology domain-containing protein DDB_G0272472-like isoform X2 n=1 Tax=Tribolium madens TaxID=41895 RepID=UPI001CF75B16|nr:calponin homology domain-containing protein DDB_G0272472-like isoform X2 [Tribolium madens]
MAIELNFVKSDNESWGFRLTGGAEYDVPLIVVKVAPNSIAENGGLRENDIIVRVNDTPTIGITHPDAHDLLVSAGNNLTLAVRRDLSSTYEQENNEEVENIMQSCIENEEIIEDERQVHFEIVNPNQLNVGDSVEEQNKTQIIAQKETKSLNASVPIVEERKWSTFLQKPKNPKPVVKKQEDAPKGEPYRVIITKQKKKTQDKNKMNETKVDTKEEVVEKNEELENVALESNVAAVQEISVRAEVTEEGEIRIEDKESEENSDAEKDVSTESNNKEQAEKNAELEKVLEEKLAEVQKQLQALAQLPSTIQSTIDAVTKQLATIVHITTSSVAESEDKAMSEVNSEFEDDKAEQAVTEESYVSSNQDEVFGELEEEKQLDAEMQQSEETEMCDETVEVEEKQVDPEESLTEEEEEAKRLERELLEKQQKEREQFEEFKQRRLKQKPTLPLKPIERPIILPGGRRWSQPDDACPSARHPKMSDEKIANTIETYSEVIVGKLKGLTIGTKSGHGPTKKSLFTESPIVVWFPVKRSQRKR